MSQTVQIYNIETLGPVVPIDAIRQVLRGLPDSTLAHPAMVTAIELVSELVGIGRALPPVRLRPGVPGGGVAPTVVGI
jgi:hypothetical protein